MGETVDVVTLLTAAAPPPPPPPPAPPPPLAFRLPLIWLMDVNILSIKEAGTVTVSRVSSSMRAFRCTTRSALVEGVDL